MSAWRSLWKQLPPYPGPAFRNNPPILGSRPIVSAIVPTSTPGICWAIFAIVLMKLTLVARKALLAYLTMLGSLRTSQDNRRELGPVEPSVESCELGS